MKKATTKRSLASIAIEVAMVLLATALAFMWGKRAALIERGYEAMGGEHLFLLLPVIYYAGKRTILDWIAELHDQQKEW